MKQPSRNMPAYSPPTSPSRWVQVAIVSVFICFVAFAIWEAPFLLAVGVGLGVWSIFETRRSKRKFEALTESRKEESICQFARSFERNSVDTWVVRAVYEQVQEWVPSPNKPLPLRAEDDLFELLELDDDDLEMDLAVEIAQRTGRSLEEPEQNPFYGKVKTVGDLVHFFNAQPLAKST